MNSLARDLQCIPLPNVAPMRNIILKARGKIAYSHSRDPVPNPQFPTAAAEMAVPVLLELHEHVFRLRKELVKSMQRKVDAERQTLTRLRTSYAFKYPRQLLHQKEQELDEKLNQLKKSIRRYRDTKRNDWQNTQRRLRFVHPGSHIRLAKREHTQLAETLYKEMTRTVEIHKERFRTLSLQLDALSPLKTMQKGFSLVYDEHQKELYRSVRSVHPGQTVSVRMHDGTLDCHVWGIKEDGEEHDSK
jgi:exodeoxyribonuclease VII large subunit